MFHEIGHSLGISANRELLDNPKETYLPGKNYLGIYFEDFDEKNYTAHIYDQYGRQAKPYAVILASENDVSALNQYLEENPDKKSIFSADNIFVVDDSMKARLSGKIYTYFAGNNVTEVLDGKTFTRADGQQISGIPINLWEGDTPDFSHLELERSMMSHQHYRSYSNFMEAELALLQDIGYNNVTMETFYVGFCDA